MYEIKFKTSELEIYADRILRTKSDWRIKKEFEGDINIIGDCDVGVIEYRIDKYGSIKLDSDFKGSVKLLGAGVYQSEKSIELLGDILSIHASYPDHYKMLKVVKKSFDDSHITIDQFRDLCIKIYESADNASCLLCLVLAEAGLLENQK